ncbi:MAG: hypothetical protein KC457_18640 [Myxococcales bacterium]|nr:hypothetical protein [Myxococcales bacterium]
MQVSQQRAEIARVPPPQMMNPPGTDGLTSKPSPPDNFRTPAVMDQHELACARRRQGVAAPSQARRLVLRSREHQEWPVLDARPGCQPRPEQPLQPSRRLHQRRLDHTGDDLERVAHSGRRQAKTSPAIGACSSS